MEKLTKERDAIKDWDLAVWSELKAKADEEFQKRQQGIQETVNKIRVEKYEPNKRMEEALKGTSVHLTALKDLAKGNLTIETGRLLVSAGAQIGANTFGAGNAGALTVQATEVELISGARFGPSGLFAAVAPGATGNGGNMVIETGRLQIADGAQVSSRTLGSGDAGSLTVRATEVEAIGISPTGPSGLFTPSAATGNGGNLTIDEFLTLEWQRLTRETAPFSLILCDVDYFKRYNDAYGHQAGDACLQQVAGAISRVIKRPVDLVARYGGEEFAVVLPT